MVLAWSNRRENSTCLRYGVWRALCRILYVDRVGVIDWRHCRPSDAEFCCFAVEALQNSTSTLPMVEARIYYPVRRFLLHLSGKNFISGTLWRDFFCMGWSGWCLCGEEQQSIEFARYSCHEDRPLNLYPSSVDHSTFTCCSRDNGRRLDFALCMNDVDHMEFSPVYIILWQWSKIEKCMCQNGTN